MSYHKEKCEELRKIRVKIAEDLGKPELVRNEPCNFSGECTGTCPACFKEEEALMKELYAKYENGQSIELNKDNDLNELDKNISTPTNIAFGGYEVDDTDNEESSVFNEYPKNDFEFSRPIEIDGKIIPPEPPTNPWEVFGLIRPPISTYNQEEEPIIKENNEEKPKRGLFGKKARKK